MRCCGIWFPFGIPFNLFFTDLCRPISSWRAVQQHPQGLFRQGHHSPSTSYCCASAWAPWRTAHASPQHPPCSQGQGLGLGTGCTGTGYSWRPILVFFCVTHACANTPHNHTHRAPSSAFPPCVSAAFLAAGTARLRARACSCFLCSFLPSFLPSYLPWACWVWQAEHSCLLLLFPHLIRSLSLTLCSSAQALQVGWNQFSALLPPSAAPITNELQTTMFPMFNLHPVRCIHNLNIGHNYSAGICWPIDRTDSGRGRETLCTFNIFS